MEYSHDLSSIKQFSIFKYIIFTNILITFEVVHVTMLFFYKFDVSNIL